MFKLDELKVLLNLDDDTFAKVVDKLSLYNAVKIMNITHNPDEIIVKFEADVKNFRLHVLKDHVYISYSDLDTYKVIEIYEEKLSFSHHTAAKAYQKMKKKYEVKPKKTYKKHF